MADNECTPNFGGEYSYKATIWKTEKETGGICIVFMFIVCTIVMYNAWEYSS
jgi:hypothetical protein